MAGFEVKAYNVATSGFSAGLVGPERSRIKGVLVYGTAVTAFTLKDGSASGETLLNLTVAAGWNDVYLPDDGILAENGCYVSAMSGTGSTITIILG
jgi:hypothetical protein